MSSVDYIRFRMAIHEGAHCVAAHHHGYRIGAASIMLESGGCVWYSSAPATPEYEPTFTGSVLHIPAAERRWLEGKACVTLAGPVAEAIYAPEMQGGYSPPEARVEDLERLTADRLRMPAEAREIVECPLDDAPSDEAIAWRLAGLSASSWQTRDEWLRWIHAEVRVWVMSEVFGMALQPVVDLLVERGEAPGDEIHALLNSVNEQIKELVMAGRNKTPAEAA